VNGMALVAILGAPVFPFPFVFDFLRNLDKGGCLLQPGVVVGVAAAWLLVVVSSRIPTAIVVRGCTLVA